MKSKPRNSFKDSNKASGKDLLNANEVDLFEVE